MKSSRTSCWYAHASRARPTNSGPLSVVRASRVTTHRSDLLENSGDNGSLLASPMRQAHTAPEALLVERVAIAELAIGVGPLSRLTMSNVFLPKQQQCHPRPSQLDVNVTAGRWERPPPAARCRSSLGQRPTSPARARPAPGSRVRISRHCDHRMQSIVISCFTHRDHLFQ